MTEHSKAETIRNLIRMLISPSVSQWRGLLRMISHAQRPRLLRTNKECIHHQVRMWGQDVRLLVSESPPLSPVRSTPGSPTAEKPGVRFMNSRGPVDKEGGRNGRTAAYRSSFSNTELSPIDLKWGMLFDGDLNPTPRLRQFLRGLANHIVSFRDSILS